MEFFLGTAAGNAPKPCTVGESLLTLGLQSYLMLCTLAANTHIAQLKIEMAKHKLSVKHVGFIGSGFVVGVLVSFLGTLGSFFPFSLICLPLHRLNHPEGCLGKRLINLP